MKLSEEFREKITKRDVLISLLLIGCYIIIELPLFCFTGKMGLLGLSNLLIVIAAFLLPLSAVLFLFMVFFVGSVFAFIYVSPAPVSFTTAIPGMITSILFAIIAIFIIKYRRINKLLQQSHDEIRILRGILPICGFCKRIRNDRGSWEQIEKYVSTHSEARFSHSFCPECAEKMYPGLCQTDDSIQKAE
jgi:hypothetical protein